MGGSHEEDELTDDDDVQEQKAVEDPEYKKLKEDNWITYLIHTLAREYGWSKSQINEIYPREAVVLIKFLAYERRDQLLQKKLDVITDNINKLMIVHGKPEEIQQKFLNILEKIESLRFSSDNTDSAPDDSDDLPDFTRLDQLKHFKETH